MDLFGGCGGISLGFATAGFRVIGSVEADGWAAASHAANFARGANETEAAAHSAARDITGQDPEEVLADLGIHGPVERQVDVLVGGPPCQAFARVGRAKLRSEALRQSQCEAEHAYLIDGRVGLWERYLHYVRRTRPLALLMENVPDILNHGGRNVAEVVARHLKSEGYRVAYTLLNAAWYGVPQTRERMFLIGIHESLESDPQFPAPTHHAVLPSGYLGTRATARKHIDPSDKHSHRWIEDPSSGLPTATTARDALVDLPPIFALSDLKSGVLRRGRKDPAKRCAYSSEDFNSPYSRLMRRWPGFETSDTTTGHVIRYLPRDFKFFKVMKEGWQYPQIWQHVENRRRVLKRKRISKGRPVDRRSTEGRAFLYDWTLPYSPEKFPNKWWKLVRDRPVRTLMAHLGKDSYSHIHFDGKQARTISIREAARLQSFPDGFMFKGSMNPAFKQIGNAVPPLLAYAVAVAMRETIGCDDVDDIRVELLGLPTKLITTTKGSATCSS